MTPTLAIVVPCYNEEEVLPQTQARLAEVLSRMQASGRVSVDSKVVFVDDGSRDATWSLIERFAEQDPRMHGIKLSRNRGHQYALLAGLSITTGDAIISVDADLQDDLDVMDQMVDEFNHGAEVVYGVRRSRSTDSIFKRSTARGYYRLMRRLGVDIVHDHADYRLLGRRALDALLQYSEVNLFLRGVIPMLGFKSAKVEYDRAERAAGISKYPLKKMLALAFDGLTSFTVTPLRLISGLGFAICLLSIGMVGWVLYGHLVKDSTIPGWASSVLPIYFLGGIQLLGLGVVGEYVAKIYLETKRRPRFIVERVI